MIQSVLIRTKLVMIYNPSGLKVRSSNSNRSPSNALVLSPSEICVCNPPKQLSIKKKE